MKLFAGKRLQMLASVGLCLVFVALAIAVWVFLFKMPAMASVVNYEWPAYTGMKRALFDAALMNYYALPAQLLFAALAIVGVVCSITQRRYFWFAVSYVLFSLIFAASAGSDGFVKHLLSGFWYTDYTRIAACAAICAIPLAALGSSWIAEGISRLVCTLSKAMKKSGAIEDKTSENSLIKASRSILCSSSIGLGLLLALAFYGPVVLYDCGILVDTSLSVAASYIKGDYDNDNHGTYDASEQEFVERVKGVVPEDSPIINIPYDGSAFAFGAEDVDVYFRSFDAGATVQNGKGNLIRDRLQNVVSDEDVASILHDAGVEYFMLLDADPQNGYTVYPHEDYDPLWSHLAEINEKTPGFELVLSEGDMRLYRILPAVEGS